jgi:hypothetical protein
MDQERCVPNPLCEDWMRAAQRLLADRHYVPAYADDRHRDNGSVYVGGAGVALALWRHAAHQPAAAAAATVARAAVLQEASP